MLPIHECGTSLHQRKIYPFLLCPFSCWRDPEPVWSGISCTIVSLLWTCQRVQTNGALQSGLLRFFKNLYLLRVGLLGMSAVFEDRPASHPHTQLQLHTITPGSCQVQACALLLKANEQIHKRRWQLVCCFLPKLVQEFGLATFQLQVGWCWSPCAALTIFNLTEEKSLKPLWRKRIQVVRTFLFY